MGRHYVRNTALLIVGCESDCIVRVWPSGKPESRILIDTFVGSWQRSGGGCDLLAPGFHSAQADWRTGPYFLKHYRFFPGSSSPNSNHGALLGQLVDLSLDGPSSGISSDESLSDNVLSFISGLFLLTSVALGLTPVSWLASRSVPKGHCTGP
jgi:hypothetical protein